MSNAKNTAQNAAQDSVARIEALAAIVTRIAQKDLDGNVDWGTAGSLAYVREQLENAANHLANISDEEEEGFANASTQQIRREAGLDTTGYPDEIRRNGEIFFFSGKEGHDIETGTPAREYASQSDDRLWVDAHGVITEA